MKNKLKLVFASGAFALVMASCSNSSSPTNSPENNQESADSLKGEAQANYVCPMGKECGYSDKPGKCGSCGMDLAAAN